MDVQERKRRRGRNKRWIVAMILFFAAVLAFRSCARRRRAVETAGSGRISWEEADGAYIENDDGDYGRDLGNKAFWKRDGVGLDASQKYPQALAEALERNQELEAFAESYFQAEKTAAGGLTQEEMGQDCPLLLQWDERWGYVPYGEDCIGLSGCGPTALAMVIFSLTRDEKATPDALAEAAKAGGYYVENEGTAWSFLVDAAEERGLDVRAAGSMSEDEMVRALRNGELMICSVGPGDFTTQGHFIVICGYENGEFVVNDPFCRANSERTWSYDRLLGQIWQTWVYGK